MVIQTTILLNIFSLKIVFFLWKWVLYTHLPWIEFHLNPLIPCHVGMDPKRNRNRMVRHSAIAMFDTDNIQDQVQVEVVVVVAVVAVVAVVVVVVDYAKTMMLCKNHDLGVQTMFLSKTMILLTISKTYGSFLLSKTMILLKSLNLRPWKISKLLLESPHTFGYHISTVWKPPHLLLVGGLEHDFYFSIIYGIIQPV